MYIPILLKIEVNYYPKYVLRKRLGSIDLFSVKCAQGPILLTLTTVNRGQVAVKILHRTFTALHPAL